MDSVGKQTMAAKALRELEAGIGREKMVELLYHNAEPTPEEETFLNHLADPRYATRPIERICQDTEFTVGKLLAFLRKSYAAKSIFQAFDQIYDKLPLTAKDVMERSIPHKRLCKGCWGQGKIDTKGGEDGESAQIEPVRCRECNGEGWIEVVPEIERQKLALQIGGVLKPAGTTIQQNTQMNVGIHVPRSTAAFRAATDKLLFPTREAAPVDETVIEVKPDGA